MDIEHFGRLEGRSFELDEEALKRVSSKEEMMCLAVLRLMTKAEIDYYKFNIADVDVNVFGPSYVYDITDAIDRAADFAPLPTIGVIVDGVKAAYTEESVRSCAYGDKVIYLSTCSEEVMWKTSDGRKVNPCDDYTMYDSPFMASFSSNTREHLAVVCFSKRVKELAEEARKEPATNEKPIARNEIFKPFVDENRLAEALLKACDKVRGRAGDAVWQGTYKEIEAAAYLYYVILKSKAASAKFDNKAAYFRFAKTKLFSSIASGERNLYNHLEKLSGLGKDGSHTDAMWRQNFQNLWDAFSETAFYKEILSDNAPTYSASA